MIGFMAGIVTLDYYNRTMKDLGSGLKVYAVLPFLISFLSCCTPVAELKPMPAAGAHVTEDLTALAKKGGVQVRAVHVSWPGPFPIERHVTPLKVRLINESGAPLNVQYENISLVNEKGAVYHALPPFKIEGEVSTLTESYAYHPFYEPGFYFDRYYVHYPYSAVYPTIPVAPYNYHFGYPLFRYPWHTVVWRADLPTPDMLAGAIPEGVLDHEGSVAGFLYFEKVNYDDKTVNLKMDLKNAENSETAVSLTLPFKVSRSYFY
ncbi:MAG: hypothetical protein J5J00_14575 [Deltaproteobacteria bacterium]|nr:hypothetical protein [Deltaproteobacteria bacterium]